MMSRRAVVTGAGGFVGRTLCRELLAAGWSVLALVRAPDAARSVADVAAGVEWRITGDMVT
jgi:uncharacterized protein YbjT (DUF2867 family)